VIIAVSIRQALDGQTCHVVPDRESYFLYADVITGLAAGTPSLSQAASLSIRLMHWL
jgi:hypothetical protein